jgi:glycosyltransferase involved in cell wall biosynthesis
MTPSSRVLAIRYDDQIFSVQHRGGISRYFLELIRAFARDPDLRVEPQPAWRWTANEHAIAAGLGARLNMPGGSSRRVLRLANAVAGRRHQRSADLLHSTYYLPRPLLSRHSPPMVVTVHDMIPELFPELFPAGNPHASKREYVQRAAAILCVSEQTKRDVQQVYGPVRQPVFVTHLGVDDAFRPGEAASGGEYLLFVGRRDAYRDFPIAVEAFAALAPRHPDIKLLAVGGGHPTRAEVSMLQRWGLTSALEFRNPNDNELPHVYRGALALMVPSRYEGFGLPALEAMACGTPVVLAQAGSLPEVGGDAALYFAPGDPHGLASQLERLLEDEGLRARLKANGIRRAASFTWQRTAIATAEAYRVAVSAGG